MEIERTLDERGWKGLYYLACKYDMVLLFDLCVTDHYPGDEYIDGTFGTCIKNHSIETFKKVLAYPFVSVHWPEWEHFGQAAQEGTYEMVEILC